MRYQIRNAKVQFGADTILNSVNFEIHDTEKIAIVGRNGCGKTTLLRLIAGDIEMSNLDSDETCGITMSGKQNIGFLRQINFTDGDVPVKEELEKAFSEVFACEARKRKSKSCSPRRKITKSCWRSTIFWSGESRVCTGTAGKKIWKRCSRNLVLRSKIWKTDR